MKKLLRKLTRVADSSHYSPLRAELREARHAESFRRRSGGGVPEGHFPVYVGDEMERFVVSADFLNHPIFVTLLNKSAQEYGYEQKGVLRIPCHVFLFERVLEALHDGGEARDLTDLLNLLSDEL
ncbi:auxin-responsive protein SAUR71-like [Primulina tabacum]|uniref:auxin-responsive protein SAUR71-like n=1 Tax=Primulina tabacum TaxID=48773 RepID=UPI003F5A7089